MLHYDHIMRLFAGLHQMGGIVQSMTDGLLQNPDAVETDISGFLQHEQGLEPSAALAVECMSKYAFYGQQTFQIGPELQEMFCQTSLKSVPREALLLPYPCFYLDLPNCPWKVWGGDHTQWHNVSGAYVVLQGDYLKVLIWGAENEKARGPGDDATVWFSLSLEECFNEHGDIEGYIDWLLMPGQSTRMNNDRGIEGLVGRDLHLKQKEAYVNIYRVAVNLILYLQTETAEIDVVSDKRRSDLQGKIGRTKNPGKKKKYERQLGKLSKATIVKVGQTVEARMKALRSQPGVKRAHWVRGHWHRYWVGKGRTKLVPRWVLPYPKNLDAEGKVEKRTYDVSTPPESGEEAPSSPPT